MRLHLGLLVLLAPAVVPACSDDGLPNQSAGQAATSTTGPDDAEGTGSLTGSSPSTTGMGEATTTEPDASGGEGPHDSGSSTSTSSGSSSSSTEGTSGTDDGSGTTEGGPSQACADGCAVEFMCGTEWPSEADCVTWCEANLLEAEDFSLFCRLAWEGVSACLGTLTCKEFAQWEDPTMVPYPCFDADVVLEVECKGQ